MAPTIYKVKEIGLGTLFVMAKPVAGEWIENEFLGLKQLGIDKVVSLLEVAEAAELGLETESELCRQHGIDFVSFPIPDLGLPESNKAISLAGRIFSEISAGRKIVIHCRAGIGRTGIVAGAVLLHAGLSSSAAISLISQARGVQVPDTAEQKEWLGAMEPILKKM